MTRVRCHHSQCIYWDDGFCSAEAIELDPETLACLTVEEIDDLVLPDEVDEWADDDEEQDKKSGSRDLWDEEDDIVVEPLEELAEEEWKEEDDDF